MSNQTTHGFTQPRKQSSFFFKFHKKKKQICTYHKITGIKLETETSPVTYNTSIPFEHVTTALIVLVERISTYHLSPFRLSRILPKNRARDSHIEFRRRDARFICTAATNQNFNRLFWHPEGWLVVIYSGVNLQILFIAARNGTALKCIYVCSAM